MAKIFWIPRKNKVKLQKSQKYTTKTYIPNIPKIDLTFYLNIYLTHMIKQTLIFCVFLEGGSFSMEKNI